MKKLLLSSALALVLNGCTGPNGAGILAGLGGPGASWRMVNPKIVQAGPTTTVSADLWEHVGTNGFPLPVTPTTK